MAESSSRCHYCGDSARWEVDRHGYSYCECQICECGAPFGEHELGCHWTDDEFGPDSAAELLERGPR
jgi:hypothetical protein